MSILVTGLVLFLGLHLIPMIPSLKARLVRGLGRIPYATLFALGAAGSLVLIVWGFGRAADAGPVFLYDPPVALRHGMMLVMLPVFPLLVAACVPTRIRTIVPHPVPLAIGLWASAHLMANGDLAAVLLFGSFLVLAVADALSRRRRLAAGLIAAPEPGTPGGDLAVIGLGLLLYAVFLWKLHLWIIGVPVI